jgi:DNA (cytosine-5)-methyltransferase 1
VKFLSVCSGIEAASVAWNTLGWEAAAFSEIDPFACAVLKHHYPSVPNLGDMTKFKEWKIEPIDLLCGGTPCQSFSVAGLRKGMADPRGNLALVFLGIADRFRPRWVVWENVPGVLSSRGGRDFGSFLGGLGQLGYGWAYRILDAQHFGVPQRRRRVFVVGYLGDWRRAAAVLFERESLSGNPPPSRKAGESFTHDVAPCVDASGCVFARTGDNRGQDPVISHAVTCHYVKGGDPTTDNYVAHALRGEGFDASEDGTGRGTPHVIAFTKNQEGDLLTGDVTAAMGTNANATGRNTPKVQTGMAVRRLTGEECEALQGFPRGYTLVPYRGKPACDGPRYKAIGNSWAVPCARWIGERIKMVDGVR